MIKPRMWMPRRIRLLFSFLNLSNSWKEGLILWWAHWAVEERNG